jgi:hypothetical protein
MEEITQKKLTLAVATLFLSGCATTYDPSKDGILDASRTANSACYFAIKGDTQFTDLIVKANYYYDNKEYSKILSILDEAKIEDRVANLYVANLRGHLMTYDAVDYARALELNKEIVDVIDESQYGQNFRYSERVLRTCYLMGSARLMKAPLLPIAAIMSPLFEKGFETPKHGYNKVATGIEKIEVTNLEHTKFVSTFFDVNLATLRWQAALRMVHIYEIISDKVEVEFWRQTASKIKN